jgi:DNA polymerase-1
MVYQAHFAFISRPILTSKGVNPSALDGFTQTLLDIFNRQQPTHIAVAFDTQAPTRRHADFPAYKATRQEWPEDLSQVARAGEVVLRGLLLLRWFSVSVSPCFR